MQQPHARHPDGSVPSPAKFALDTVSPDSLRTVPLGSTEEEEKESLSGTEYSTHSSSSSFSGIGSTLKQYGVLLLSPKKREALVQKLVDLGVTEEQIADVAEYVFTSEPDPAKARKYLCTALMDPESFVIVVQDVAGYKLEEAKKSKKADPSPYPGEGDWIRKSPPEAGDWIKGDAKLSVGDPAQWERDRRDRIAYCRVVADRKSWETVASELGVLTDQIPDMVLRGAELQGDKNYLKKHGKELSK